MHFALCISPALATDLQQPRLIPPGYKVQTIATPEGVDFEVGGIAFMPDSSMLVTTRFGDVWRHHNSSWSLFATGLHEALGVWVDPKTGDVYVVQRPELTRLVDEDHDGHADLYQTVCAEWGFSGNYHEYAFGPVRDSKGNFYVTLNLSHADKGKVRNSVMGMAAPFRGWCVQITPLPEGKMIPFANGMRSPAGLGISQDDELWYTDNQGDFNATSGLYHIEKGRFFGHPNSLANDPRFAGKDLNSIPIEELDAMRTRPAVWIPYADLANSPGEPTYDYTAGKFGPFTGQIFVGDQTRSNIMRIALEKVGGHYQGAIFDFVDHLDSGVIRNAFGPDGALYAGMTARGWGSIGARSYALQRVVYNGRTIPFEMHSISLAKDGFDITFTRPANPSTATNIDRYLVRHWGYLYHPEYGSPKVDETFLSPRSLSLSPDGKTVHVELPTVAVNRVYQLTLINVTAATGEKLTNNTGYYTVNRLRE